MIAIALLYKQYGHWLKWAAMALAVLSLWLYVAHLRGSRDAAVHTAQSLQVTLDDERRLAAGLAQMEHDKSAAAASAAAATVVQKKREIDRAQTEIKKEIEYVYINKGNDACFGTDFKRLWNAANNGAGGVQAPAAP